jgi:predicted RNase H-like HicB family nuclease
MKYTFTYIIELDEDGNYVADVPALPGCHTQAKSLDELKERVLEAIHLYLEETGTFTEKSRFIGVQQIEALIE